MTTVSAGDILAGKYRVERVLGMGGMGIVVAALHIELLERRAIKLMRPEGIDSPESVERFLREARAAARLRSEHVAKVHDVGRLENGAPYMVMEYLEGTDLSALLKRSRSLPVEESVLYVLQACEALAEAHGAGIIHRDLKPANLFLTQDTAGAPRIKVLDFGISKAMGPGTEGALNITRSDALLGSPLFMSPEQMRSPRDADARSDIWAIGAILYKLITGRAPFMADSILSLFLLVMDKPPPAPSSHRAEIPPELDAVILRCLEKERADRFDSVVELAEALLPFAPASAGGLVDKISRVFSSGPASSVSVPSQTLRSEVFVPPPAEGRVTRPDAETLTDNQPLPVSEWRDAGTESGPPSPRTIASGRDEALETSGSWGNTRRGVKPRRPWRSRTSIAVASALGGALVTAVAVVAVMRSGAPTGAAPQAEASIAPLAAVVGRGFALAPSPSTSASAPASAPASDPAPASAPVSASASASVSASASASSSAAISTPAPRLTGPPAASPPPKKPPLRSRTTF